MILKFELSCCTFEPLPKLNSGFPSNRLKRRIISCMYMLRGEKNMRGKNSIDSPPVEKIMMGAHENALALITHYRLW